jgi:hypothetical protein
LTPAAAPGTPAVGVRETPWVIVPCLDEVDGVTETVGDTLRLTRQVVRGGR